MPSPLICPCTTRRGLLLAALTLTACSRDPQAEGPRYGPSSALAGELLRLAVHPLHNPARLSRAYQPLLDHLNRQLAGPRLELEASRNYASFEAKFRHRSPALLLPNPWQTLQAMASGYRVVAMAGHADDFRGLWIVRRDSPLRRPTDLRGHAVAFPAPTALAACVMPQWFLHGHGLDVLRDLDTHYVGSQESTLLNVLNGQVSAGGTWPPVWRAFQKLHPEQAAQLRVAWETPPLVNNSVMVRDDLPAAFVDALRAVLLGVQHSAGGSAVLEAIETAGFMPATDDSYAPVREFVARFEREVRPVDPT